MSNLTRKLRRQQGADADKFFPNMPMGQSRKSGRKAQHGRRLFDAANFFRLASDLPKPPHKLGLELRYHVTKGFRWEREGAPT